MEKKQTEGNQKVGKPKPRETEGSRGKPREGQKMTKTDKNWEDINGVGLIGVAVHRSFFPCRTGAYFFSYGKQCIGKWNRFGMC